MAWLDTSTVQLGAQVTGTLVALLALFIGLRNEARNQKRFERQLALSEAAARAAARPILAIEREGYENVKAVSMSFIGAPLASVFRTRIAFQRGRVFRWVISLMIGAASAPSRARDYAPRRPVPVAEVRHSCGFVGYSPGYIWTIVLSHPLILLFGCGSATPAIFSIT